MKRPTLRLQRPLRRAIERGHPWIFDRAAAVIDAAPGAVVTVVDQAGPLATAFVDPGGPICARVIDRDPAAEVGDDWARERARRAAARRAIPPDLASTDALRAIHGENDGLPGLTIDVYAGIAVVVFDGAAAAAFWRSRLAAAIDGVRAGGIAVHATWVRPVRGGDRSGDRGEGSRHGDAEVPARVAIREGAARFEVDVRRGQKTGFFLDQRANRARVGALAAGARVLNLFSYTGGFSVQAGLGGAAQVTSVDVAAPAIADADRHWRDNRLPPERHQAVAADAFDFLGRAAAEHRAWDLVIVDPPSFAPSEAARTQALAAYQRLNRMALAVTAPDGVLVSASCSSHVHASDLRTVVAAAAGQLDRELRIIETRGAAADHPVRAGFPEGDYLDLLIAV